MKNEIDKYIEGVLNDKIISGMLCKLAVKRYLADLQHPLFYFDEKAAIHALTFFSMLRHYKGEFAKKEFVLSDWQKFVVWNLFGFKKKSDGYRRFTSSYIEIAKKNGKTTFAAGIALYMLTADQEPAAEVYTAATKLTQAKICFDAARAMVIQSKHLSKRLEVYKTNLHNEIQFSKMEPVASDSDKLDGINSSCAIIDEYHAHKNSDLRDNLLSSMVARRQPLEFIITTAGFNKEGPCYRMRKVATDILNGIKKDESFFIMIFSADEDDDWNVERNWIKANPNLGQGLTIDKIRESYVKALNNPENEVSFKTKNLNMWVDASKVWIPNEIWASNYRHEVELEEYRGRECYAALDLASTRDLTSLCLLFPEDDGYFSLFWFFFMPEMPLKDRVKRDRVNYDLWAREGYITVTSGNATDYNEIFSRITGYTRAGEKTENYEGIAEMFDLKAVAFDPWNASFLVSELVEANVEMLKFQQGMYSMSYPTKEFLRLVYEAQLNHGNNPVARWNLSNIEIKRDAAGNIMPDKGKSAEKIDGIVAAIMCVGTYLNLSSTDVGFSVYTA